MGRLRISSPDARAAKKPKLNQDDMNRGDPVMDTQVEEVRRESDERYARTALVITLLIVLVAGAIGRFVDADRVGAIGLLIFALLGPGAAVISFARVPGGLPGRLCIAFGLSVTLLTGVSLVSVYLHVWAPTPTLAVIVAIAALALLASVVRPDSQPGKHSTPDAEGPGQPDQDVAAPSRFAMTGPHRWWFAAQIVAVVLCLVGALTSRTDNPPIGGFLRTVNPVWYVGIVVLAAAATMAFFASDASRLPRFAPASAALSLCSTIALTPVIIYGTPRSQSAEKHIALSELIARTHGLKASQTIYNDWPGLFSASAWLKDFCGIGDLISLATWWPVILILFRLMAMRLLAGVFLENDRLAWVASIVVFLATPGGIDYYSPQAIGYTVGLAILWIAVSKAFTLRSQIALVFLLSCGVVVTHQLTPYIVGGALVVLAVFRQLARWWIPALILVPTLAWTGIHFDQVKHFISPSSVGSTGNYSLPSQRATSDPGTLVDSAIALTAVALVIVGLFALATLLRNRRSGQAWGLAVASLVGFVAVFINAYGNEGTFRAVFFAVPWLTVLAISSISELHVRRPEPGLVARAVSALIIVLIPLSFVGSYALDGSTVIRRGDRDFLIGLRDRATANPEKPIVIVSLGSADYPSVTAARTRSFKLYRASLTALVREMPPASSGFATELAEQVAPLLPAENRKNASLFVFSSSAVNDYQDEYGEVSLAQSQQIRTALKNSPAWTRVYVRGGTVGYRLNVAADGE